MSNIMKYVSTLVDGKPTCLGLSYCNYCPFLKLEHISKNIYCTNNGKKLIKKINAYSYSNGYWFPLNDINIPYWCELSFDFFKTLVDKIVFYKKGSLVISETMNFVSKDITNDDHIKYVNNKLVIDYKSKNTTKNPVEPIIIKKICSMCGEDKNDVNRNDNMGMCNDCWNRFELDDEKNHFAFINNFRLKRKANYSKESFKKITTN